WGRGGSARGRLGRLQHLHLRPDRAPAVRPRRGHLGLLPGGAAERRAGVARRGRPATAGRAVTPIGRGLAATVAAAAALAALAVLVVAGAATRSDQYAVDHWMPRPKPPNESSGF